MRVSGPQETSPAGRFGDETEDRSVRSMVRDFVETIARLDSGVDVRTSAVETRFFYRDHFLCRVAAYRELFHVQIGDDPAWEVRIRSSSACHHAVERVLERFLALRAAGKAPA